MVDVIIKNVDEEVKRKALFVVRAKGSNLSETVRKVLEQEAREFEKYIGG